MSSFKGGSVGRFVSPQHNPADSGLGGKKIGGGSGGRRASLGLGLPPPPANVVPIIPISMAAVGGSSGGAGGRSGNKRRQSSFANSRLGLDNNSTYDSNSNSISHNSSPPPFSTVDDGDMRRRGRNQIEVAIEGQGMEHNFYDSDDALDRTDQVKNIALFIVFCFVTYLVFQKDTIISTVSDIWNQYKLKAFYLAMFIVLFVVGYWYISRRKRLNTLHKNIEVFLRRIVMKILKSSSSSKEIVEVDAIKSELKDNLFEDVINSDHFKRQYLRQNFPDEIDGILLDFDAVSDVFVANNFEKYWKIVESAIAKDGRGVFSTFENNKIGEPKKHWSLINKSPLPSIGNNSTSNNNNSINNSFPDPHSNSNSAISGTRPPQNTSNAAGGAAGSSWEESANMKLIKGERVLYCKGGESLHATIVGVHEDDYPNIYYSIRFSDGREKQTDRKYLATAKTTATSSPLPQPGGGASSSSSSSSGTKAYPNLQRMMQDEIQKPSNNTNHHNGGISTGNSNSNSNGIGRTPQSNNVSVSGGVRRDMSAIRSRNN